MADGNVCVDCLMLEAFQPAEGVTYEEGLQLGLVPGLGNTLCGDACRCSWLPRGYIESAATTDEVDLKVDKFVYIILAEGVRRLGRQPEKVAQVKDLIRQAMAEGYSEAELQRRLRGLATLAAVIAVLEELLEE